MVPEDANVRFLGFYAETCHSETDPDAASRQAHGHPEKRTCKVIASEKRGQFVWCRLTC